MVSGWSVGVGVAVAVGVAVGVAVAVGKEVAVGAGEAMDVASAMLATGAGGELPHATTRTTNAEMTNPSRILRIVSIFTKCIHENPLQSPSRDTPDDLPQDFPTCTQSAIQLILRNGHRFMSHPRRRVSISQPLDSRLRGAKRDDSARLSGMY